MKPVFRPLGRLTACTLYASTAVFVVACGGADAPSNFNGSISSPVSATNTTSPNSMVVTAGDPIVIPGRIKTDLNLLTGIAWSAGVDGGGEPLVLSNDKCAVVQRNDKPIIGSTNGSTGASDWTCDLGVVTPVDIKADTFYSIGLTGVDDKKAVYSQRFTLRVVPNQAYLASNYINAAGPDFDVKSGGTVALNCAGPTTSSYQWVVVDAHGYNVNLVTTGGASSTFVAPIVQSATPIKLACRMTDKNNRVTTSFVSATVRPPSYVSASNAGQNFTVKSGQTAPLYCQGLATSKYAWSVVGNSGLPITLASNTAQQTSFVAPRNINVNTPIVIRCSISDTSNVVTQSDVIVTIVPASTGGGTAAGVDFSIASGKVAPLFCQGPTTSTYAWAVSKNVGGLPITFTSYTSQQTSFTAPSVTTDTPITVSCTETDTQGVATTSSVIVTIGTSTGANSNTLVAKITGPTTALPGQTLAFTSASGWFDNNGASATGGVISYTWALSPTAPAGFSLSNTTGSATSLFVPSTQSTPVLVPITLTATAGSSTSTATATVLVDPSGTGFVPTITPPSQTVVGGTAVSLVVNGGTPQMFYQWTVASGPVVPLGGETTSRVGFIAPTVAADTTIRLRVAIGYAPITVSNPGFYFVEGVVNVTP